MTLMRAVVSPTPLREIFSAVSFWVVASCFQPSGIVAAILCSALTNFVGSPCAPSGSKNASITLVHVCFIESFLPNGTGLPSRFVRNSPITEWAALMGFPVARNRFMRSLASPFSTFATSVMSQNSSAPVPGQRWVSDTEPELGLGIVLKAEFARVEVLFPAANEMRQYALKTAPLRRVKFQEGDTIKTHDGVQFTVDSVQERNG